MTMLPLQIYSTSDKNEFAKECKSNTYLFMTIRQQLVVIITMTIILVANNECEAKIATVGACCKCNEADKFMLLVERISNRTHISFLSINIKSAGHIKVAFLRTCSYSPSNPVKDLSRALVLTGTHRSIVAVVLRRQSERVRLFFVVDTDILAAKTTTTTWTTKCAGKGTATTATPRTTNYSATGTGTNYFGKGPTKAATATTPSRPTGKGPRSAIFASGRPSPSGANAVPTPTDARAEARTKSSPPTLLRGGTPPWTSPIPLGRRAPGWAARIAGTGRIPTMPFPRGVGSATEAGGIPCG
jgi:hypothetical protein